MVWPETLSRTRWLINKSAGDSDPHQGSPLPVQSPGCLDLDCGPTAMASGCSRWCVLLSDWLEHSTCLTKNAEVHSDVRRQIRVADSGFLFAAAAQLAPPGSATHPRRESQRACGCSVNLLAALMALESHTTSFNTEGTEGRDSVSGIGRKLSSISPGATTVVGESSLLNLQGRKDT